MSKPNQTFGLLAEYSTARDIYHACETVRDAGYVRWDSHTPYPVHNLDKAMGLRPSPLPWIVFAAGMTGASCGFLLQWWVSTIAYPIIVHGKPYFSYQAFVPVTFELGILFSAFGAVLGMLLLEYAAHAIAEHDYSTDHATAPWIRAQLDLPAPSAAADRHLMRFSA